jgi:hypothetical protein
VLSKAPPALLYLAEKTNNQKQGQKNYKEGTLSQLISKYHSAPSESSPRFKAVPQLMPLSENNVLFF